MQPRLNRPKTIIAFEILSIFVLTFGVIRVVLNWPEEAVLTSPWRLLVIQSFVAIITIVLILFVSRKRSVIALIIFSALFILGIPSLFFLLRSGHIVGSSIITIVLAAIQAIALIFLLAPSARRWISRRDEVTKDVFS